MGIRFKLRGKKEYAYEIWNEKNTTTGKWHQKSKYLGVVEDKENKVFVKPNDIKKQQRDLEKNELAILDYGDTYLLNELINKNDILPVFRDIFKDNLDTLLSLIFYRIEGGLAMRHVENWYNGNIASKLFPQAKITTQNISEFLKYLGDEKLQRDFFKKYIKNFCSDKTGLIIDSTGLPNEINMPITEWGYHNGGIEKETRLILAVEKETKMPLFFRYIAGNIGDVSTLTTTLKEIKQLGVIPSLSIIDAGYFSENNIKALYQGNVDFLTRMPSTRIIYKELINKTKEMEKPENIVKYNERGLFIKEEQIDLYGNVGFAYIICDPERRGKEISKKVINYENQKEEDLDLLNCGKFIIVSSTKIPTNEVIPLYYTRQSAEQLFGISKDDLNILPIRTHTETTFKGFMFLIFLALTIYSKTKKVLGDIAIEQALSLLRNLKCKVYEENLIVSEVNKKQKLLLEKCGVLVPKNMGV